MLRRVFKLTRQVKSKKSNSKSEITAGTKPFHLRNTKRPMASLT